MSYSIQTAKYPTAGVSKLLATSGGAHIFDVKLSTDAWNGALIKRGAYQDFHYYAEVAATEIDLKIVDQAANGNWYVEVMDDTDVLLVYNVPLPDAQRNESNGKSWEDTFYLKAGVDMARAHELKKGDIFELSTNGFSGTPAKNAVIETISGKKPVIKV